MKTIIKFLLCTLLCVGFWGCEKNLPLDERRAVYTFKFENPEVELDIPFDVAMDFDITVVKVYKIMRNGFSVESELFALYDYKDVRKGLALQSGEYCIVFESATKLYRTASGQYAHVYTIMFYGITNVVADTPGRYKVVVPVTYSVI